MFKRDILRKLSAWAKKIDRKPLVLRGARQVGKTTAVKLFSEEFDQYLYLNLEQKVERNIFEQDYPIEELIQAIFFYKDQVKLKGKILIFIDEIQTSPSAVSYLRFFYESFPDLYIIAAGSLLETLIDTHISFPVGRVEYLVLKPLNFKEFLNALNEKNSLDIIKNNIPAPSFAHDKLLKLFHTYSIIGGMPEIIQRYSDQKDIISLNSVFDSLIVSYLDDVEKYARNNSMANVIRHAVSHSFYEAGNRIKFQGFGNSNYKSREMGEALKVLEKAMLIYLLYPSSAVKPPLVPNIKKSPKLQVLDTGILNYFGGFQKELFGTNDIDSVYQGKIAEHIVGQELLACQTSPLYKLHFWSREKKQSNAEIDFLIQYEDLIVPVEVKSGATGRLRSLHQFIDRTPHKYAVRIYSGQMEINRIKTLTGKDFTLLNLPFYLAGSIPEYLEWLISQ
ncbi:MAG: AAA family ATPase [Deltaproteobacteria bacterium]|jgi:predicted AAA+ superfamily ATPase|nr:AAA family ATPase [Deltaproteobacteria bacterium]